MNYLLVALGGALGSMCRYSLGILCARFMTMPLGISIATLVVNVIGAFLIGLIMGIHENGRLSGVYLFSVVGFCGGFTTFSAFSFESVKMIEKNIPIAVLYMFAMLVLCLVSVWGGMAIVRYCK